MSDVLQELKTVLSVEDNKNEFTTIYTNLSVLILLLIISMMMIMKINVNMNNEKL